MSQRRRIERNAGKQMHELDPKTRLQVRPVLMKGLQDSGALIFERALTGGHKVYVVMPGESGEVSDEHCNAVWNEIADALIIASDTARTVAALPFASEGANVVKGGSS